MQFFGSWGSSGSPQPGIPHHDQQNSLQPQSNAFPHNGLVLPVADTGASREKLKDDVRSDAMVSASNSQEQERVVRDSPSRGEGQEWQATEALSLDPEVAVKSREDHEELRVISMTETQAPHSLVFDVTKYTPLDDILTSKRRKPVDRSSAPPEPLGSLRDREGARRLRHLDRFSKDILPPPTAPVYLQIITYIQRWGIWATTVKDAECRERLITAIADKMENVWLEGMKQGHIPEQVEGQNGINASDSIENTNTSHQRNPSSMTATQLAASIMNTAGRGRPSQQQPRRKRPVSPSRVVVLRPRRLERRDLGITAGELEEAGVTMGMIQDRVQSGDLDEDDELLNDVLEQVDREVIDDHDWYGVAPKTTYNFLGRDLMVYCLWEVQRSRQELDTLNNLMERFTHANQIKNTQARMDDERRLHDQFLALALIINDNVVEGSEMAKEATYSRSGEAHGSPEDITAPPEPLLTLDISEDDAQGDMVVEEEDGDGQALSRHSSEKRKLEFDDLREIHTTKKMKTPDGSATDVLSYHDYATAAHFLGAPGRSFTPTSSTSSISTRPSVRVFKQGYIDGILLAKVNKLLEQHEQAPLPEGTPWKLIKIVLANSGVSLATRNTLAQELNDNMQTQGQTQADSLDVPGLPTTKEIIANIPPEGLSPKELNGIFGGMVNPNDVRWYDLVRSVAYRDKAKNRWFTINGPALAHDDGQDVLPAPMMLSGSSKNGTAQLSGPVTSHEPVSIKFTTRKMPPLTGTGPRNISGHTKTFTVPGVNIPAKKRLIILLKTKAGFNPKDYSSRNVTNTKSFRWRYLPNSTVAERDSMDDMIAIYVADRIAFDRTKKRDQVHAAMEDRFGQYEVLSHTRNPGRPIVHGIWDYRDKSEVKAAKWFYEGKHGEWAYPVYAFDDFGSRYTENQAELDAQKVPTAKEAIARRFSLDGQEDAKVRIKGKSGKKGKGKPSKAVREGKIPPPPPPPLAMASPRTRRQTKTEEGRRTTRRGVQGRKTHGSDDRDSDGDWKPY